MGYNPPFGLSDFIVIRSFIVDSAIHHVSHSAVDDCTTYEQDATHAAVRTDIIRGESRCRDFVKRFRDAVVL